MAMLAEKRSKCKLVLNPIAKPLWKSDACGDFGKKLMEKMGWSPGKGLGSQEQGIQEPLRSVYKSSNSGVGYKGDGNPFHNQDEFNAILSSLGSDSTTNPDVSQAHTFESLEEKSKNCKTRVHYKKFTRGKDVSRYSAIDLACILGTGKKEEEPLIDQYEDQPTGSTDHAFGVTTINSGSIDEYFKVKFGKKPKNSGDEFSDKHDVLVTTGEIEEIDGSGITKKKKKKPSQQNSIPFESRSDVPVTLDEPVFQKDNMENKKRKLSEDEIACDVPQFNQESTVDVVEKSKGKRKKKSENLSVELEDFQEGGLEVIGEKENNMISNDTSAKIKRKKRHRSDPERASNENGIDCEQEINEHDSNCADIAPRLKNKVKNGHVKETDSEKKKKTKDHEENILEKPNENDCKRDDVSVEKKVKRKKKQLHADGNLEETIATDILPVTLVEKSNEESDKTYSINEKEPLEHSQHSDDSKEQEEGIEKNKLVHDTASTGMKHKESKKKNNHDLEINGETNGSNNAASQEVENGSTSTIKHKKSKKKNNHNLEINGETNGSNNVASLEVENDSTSTMKHKKSKKKNNHNLEINDETNGTNNVASLEVENDSTSTIKHKKSKKKNNQNLGVNEEMNCSDNQESLENNEQNVAEETGDHEEKQKVKKKKKRKEEKFNQNLETNDDHENMAIEDKQQQVEDALEIDEKLKTKAKRKKTKSSQNVELNDVDEFAVNGIPASKEVAPEKENKPESLDDVADDSEKKSKKKHKKSPSEDSIEETKKKIRKVSKVFPGSSLKSVEGYGCGRRR